MRRFPSSLPFALVSAGLAAIVVACSGGQIAVGKSDQQLQRRPDGSPTGNGESCSWADTPASSPAAPSAAGPYKVGDEFKSPDGCNDCSCTADGIACTDRACPGVPCSNEAKICPDGTGVGRVGPRCEFAPCPTGCSKDGFICPDGTTVGRVPPSCEFAACPGAGGCSKDGFICPDGTTVGRVPPSCEFAPCPSH